MKSNAWFIKKGKTQARKDAAIGCALYRGGFELSYLPNGYPECWWESYVAQMKIERPLFDPDKKS